MILLFVTALALPVLAAIRINDHLAMGPDPGGRTGAAVTPETTNTGSPAVDAARQSASGSKTETNEPAGSTSQVPGQKK